LPSHRQRRQMPAMPARDPSAVGVGLLMTGRALKRWDTIAVRPAHDVGEVAMPIFPLLRIIRGGVAVEPAGVGQYGVDLLPGGKTLRACRGGAWRCPCSTCNRNQKGCSQHCVVRAHGGLLADCYKDPSPVQPTMNSERPMGRTRPPR